MLVEKKGKRDDDCRNSWITIKNNNNNDYYLLLIV